jgi:D-glycero-alpha-D-manno-heptose 1-phosphate guanylyltransferase
MLTKDIDVFILCGGRGRRLRTVTRSGPKPMAKVGHTHFLDLILNYFIAFGFHRFILGTGYKAGVIEGYYHKNRRPGINIIFSHEDKPLDTGGALKKAKELIRSNPFFVLNGDSLSKFNPQAFLDFHRRNNSRISILLKRVVTAEDYGKIQLGSRMRIVSFSEKQTKARNCFVNAGVYLFDKGVFKLMPKKQKFSLEKDFFPKLAGKEIFGYPFRGFFIDIGTPERHKRANRYFKANP